jgi:DNA-binding CsgD family transcriptional regulator
VSRRRRLSPREREIITLISTGLTTDEIAYKLDLSKWTVRDKIRKLCKMFDCPMRELPGKVGRL